jgi:5-formyltetrahydrofolate cyclo-ligase
MNKSAMRKTLLERRRAIAPEVAGAKSAAILDRLKALPELITADTVLCYVSSKDNEVDTRRLIEWLLGEKRRVLVPITEPKGKLVWSELHSLDELAPGRFDILEPRMERRRVVVPPEGAPVIVPGIAFAPDRRRIGYGGGYFDRFLAAYRGVSIGLAFDIQIVPDFESHSRDIPVNFVVTESRVYGKSTAPRA